jgi:large subunit ribosomal protein L28
MTRRCELTGKGPMSGNIRSHAENATRRTFRPNLVNVTLMSEALGKKIRVKVCANGLKTVEHRGGLDAFLLKSHDEDLSLKCLQLKRELRKHVAEKAAA